jgi:hypothetical protein
LALSRRQHGGVHSRERKITNFQIKQASWIDPLGRPARVDGVVIDEGTPRKTPGADGCVVIRWCC